LSLPKKKKRKGFTRSRKAWEESCSTHLGHIIDNLKGEDLLNLFAAAVCAYGGYHAGEELGADVSTRLAMAGTGVLAYQLSKAMNVVAGGSGVAVLAAYGIVNVWNPLATAVRPLIPTKEDVEQWKAEWQAAAHVPTWDEYREFWTKYRMP